MEQEIIALILSFISGFLLCGIIIEIIIIRGVNN